MLQPTTLIPDDPFPIRRRERAAFPSPQPPIATDDPELAAIAVVLIAWLDRPGWEAARAWLSQHGDVLARPLAIGVLTCWIHANEASGTELGPAVGTYLRWHRRVLWRGFQHGIVPAWAYEASRD